MASKYECLSACLYTLSCCILANWQVDQNFKSFPSSNICIVLKRRKKCFPRTIMTFYIQIFTLSEVFKCNILPQHEVTFDTSIGLTIHRKEGRKDASLHFTRTKLIYSKAWSTQAGDVLSHTGRVILYYWQNSRSSFIASKCCKINKEYNKVRSITPKKAKHQIIAPGHPSDWSRTDQPCW